MNRLWIDPIASGRPAFEFVSIHLIDNTSLYIFIKFYKIVKKGKDSAYDAYKAYIAL